MKLTHFRLMVPNIRECFIFYRDILGFTVLHGTEETPYAEFHAGGINLALEPSFEGEAAVSAEATALKHGFHADDKALLVFSEPDVDAAYARLAGKGVRFVKEPHDTPEWGHRVAYFRDPAGTLIEINGGL